MTVEIFETVALYSLVQSEALLFIGDHNSPSFCSNNVMISEADPKGLTGGCYCRRMERLAIVEKMVVTGNYVCVRITLFYPYCTCTTYIILFE